jgi:hypothetical protein
MRVFNDPKRIGFTSYWGAGVIKKTWFDESSECKGLVSCLVGATDKEVVDLTRLKLIKTYLPPNFDTHLEYVQNNSTQWLKQERMVRKFFESKKVKVHVGFFLTMTPNYK